MATIDKPSGCAAQTAEGRRDPLPLSGGSITTPTAAHGLGTTTWDQRETKAGAQPDRIESASPSPIKRNERLAQIIQLAAKIRLYLHPSATADALTH
jgi:hypothetical protein